MSYYAEHLAWQQRVDQEARRKNAFEKWANPRQIRTIQNDFGSQHDVNSNAFYSQWVKDNYKTSNNFASEGLRSVDSKPGKQRKNLQAYTFGGMKNIRKTTMYSELSPNKFKIQSEYNMSSDFPVETGREVLTGFGGSMNNSNAEYISLERPKKPKVMNFFDQAYGTNVIKRARERPQSCRSGYSRKSSIMQKLKVFKAPDPYRNSGGEFIRSQVKQKEKDDRFNENISVTSKQVTESRRMKAQAANKAQNSGSATTALKREIETRKQLEQELNSNRFEQKVESYSQMDGQNGAQDVNANHYLAEDAKDDEHQALIENIELDSKISKRTYIHDLQKAINEEREKRLQLEKQIEELKKINSDISSQLGLKAAKGH